ncbi:MAG: tectonin domain-containing protein, partial [Pyrinomonadaceae bacterium]
IDGTAARIAVDNFGFPWVVKSTGEILRRNGRTWITLPGTATDIDIGDNGDVWIVGRDGWLRHWGGEGWIDDVKTDAMRVAVNGNGVPWIMTRKGQLLIADFAGKFSGAAKAVATGSDGSMWLIAPDLSIFRWTSETKWKQEIKGKFAEISVAPGGKLYAVDASGNIYHSNQ